MPNHGVPVELLLESLVSEVEELTDQVREPLETCVEVDADLHQLVFGDDGNEK